MTMRSHVRQAFPGEQRFDVAADHGLADSERGPLEAIIGDGDDARVARFGRAGDETSGGFGRADQHDGFGEHALLMGCAHPHCERSVHAGKRHGRDRQHRRERAGVARVGRKRVGDHDAEESAQG